MKKMNGIKIVVGDITRLKLDKSRLIGFDFLGIGIDVEDFILPIQELCGKNIMFAVHN